MKTRQQVICQVFDYVDGARPDKKPALYKHQIMAGSPFRFLRGAASLFYHDIKNAVITLPESLADKRLLTCIMGDCHISNFGFFSEEGSHGDTIIFAPNDFDDACVGHATWDLLRFLVSLHLTQDYCQRVIRSEVETDEVALDRIKSTVSDVELSQSLHAFLASYVTMCEKLCCGEVDRRYVLNQFKKGHVLRKLEKKAQKRAAGGKHFTTKSALAKLIDIEASGPQFDFTSPKLSKVENPLFSEIKSVFRPYVDDDILDVAERLGAGTGSVNMKRYYLLVGPKRFNQEADLPLCHIVEVKQQRVAAPVTYFANYAPQNQQNAAHLTVTCQQRMQRRPDLVLDDVEWRGHHWLVRSRHHAKVGIKPELLGLSESSNCSGMVSYAHECGSALALAHCRGDRRSHRFEQAVMEILPEHVDVLLESAKAYANQTIEDYIIVKEMLETG
ncbi:DUF2252 family protein [Alteromonas sp. a30]|uniref:DUF2252 family protein n=1 Tax=Alteromonas sp. a30 TaxID=2730917 RepID=UPI0022807E17|nr:DUF2252 family protein [Alteromonas sp. a30]MCY7295698.1 DUF2252 family protein [Alteromonas sp. a30]